MRPQPSQVSNPHYLKRYQRFISLRKNRIVEGYSECHHILPKSMGGDDSSDNLVNLTAREHYVAHLLLWKAYQNPQTLRAFLMMNVSNEKQLRWQGYSRVFEQARTEYNKINGDAIRKLWEQGVYSENSKIQKQLVNEGKHVFSKKGLEHPATQSARQMVEQGKHHLQKRSDGTSISSDAVKNGTHNTQRLWTCLHCGLRGMGTPGFSRWGHHDGSCKSRQPAEDGKYHCQCGKKFNTKGHLDTHRHGRPNTKRKQNPSCKQVQPGI